ncbi:hypothetical protein O2W14_12495 [Modestobacter sp. VKM Ac-2986]|uniref:hypothetical protein n=1 Tax=Modestobacter sp. VKM Ac-2986 TaxID=3004140 RepID=UPI0022AB6EC7|nr:hypothetical protein [Modestobacter sp. VKM Ac-2986]MCZ2829653.1 hypothetical protein [Modestobacter sp. VKM Ac-2986]
MNSTDTTTVGTTVTSPAAGTCAAVLGLGWSDTPGAPSTTTGLPFAGMAVRLRGWKAAEGRTHATGVLSGTGVLPTVQIDAQRRPATPGGYAERTNSTPGDLPPVGPLS